jgi:hypothetical protein
MIKEIIALLVFLIIAGLTIYLTVKRRIGNTLTVTLLAFSLLTGLAIANYDLIGRMKWEIPGLSIFRSQVSQTKDQALEDIRNEAEFQREIIRPLIADLNATAEKIDSGIKYAEVLLESIKKGEERLKKEELDLKEKGVRIEQATEQSLAVYRASSELALLLTKAIWLQLQAKEDSDPKRREAAIRLVMDQLDAIVDLVIEDPQVRSEFVNSVMGSLPSRK